MSTLFKFVLVIVIVCIGLLFFGHVFLGHNIFNRLTQFLVKHRWVFIFWRYGFYSLILVVWPHFIKFIGIRKNWQPQVLIYFSNQRLKLFGLFVIIEIFFIYNLIAHLFAWM